MRREASYSRLWLHVDATSLVTADAAYEKYLLKIMALRNLVTIQGITLWASAARVIRKTTDFLEKSSTKAVEDVPIRVARHFTELTAADLPNIGVKDHTNIIARFDIDWTKSSLTEVGNCIEREFEKRAPPAAVAITPVLKTDVGILPSMVVGSLLLRVYGLTWFYLVWRFFLRIPYALLSWIVDKQPTIIDAGMDPYVVFGAVVDAHGSAIGRRPPTSIKWISPENPPTWSPTTPESFDTWLAIRKNSRFSALVGGTLMLWIIPVIQRLAGVKAMAIFRPHSVYEGVNFSLYGLAFSSWFLGITILMAVRIAIITRSIKTDSTFSWWMTMFHTAFPFPSLVTSLSGTARYQLGAVGAFLYHGFMIIFFFATATGGPVNVYCILGLMMIPLFAFRSWVVISTWWDVSI